MAASLGAWVCRLGPMESGLSRLDRGECAGCPLALWRCDKHMEAKAITHIGAAGTSARPIAPPAGADFALPLFGELAQGFLVRPRALQGIACQGYAPKEGGST